MHEPIHNSFDTIEPRPQLRRRTTRALASGSLALSLAACSLATEAPAQTETVTATASKTPVPSDSAPGANKAPNLKAIECHQIVRGDVMVECTNVPSGHYDLHLKSPNTRSIAHYYQQSDGATVELIPDGAYTPLCTEGFVTFFPIPKDGTGKEYIVYSFDVCGPETV